MPDQLTSEQRHRNMAAIRAKDTKPERIVRKYLWRHGIRYRLNHPRLPGKPDIVMRKYRTCVFVNGCFWHGHRVNCDHGGGLSEISSSDCCKIPKTNRTFWVGKIMRNRKRDTEVMHELAGMGWHSITVWECELKPDRRDATLESLLYTLNRIYLQDHQVRMYDMPEEDTHAMVADSAEDVK